MTIGAFHFAAELIHSAVNIGPGTLVALAVLVGVCAVMGRAGCIGLSASLAAAAVVQRFADPIRIEEALLEICKRVLMPE